MKNAFFSEKMKKNILKTGLLLGLVLVMLLGACPNNGDKDFDLGGSNEEESGSVRQVSARDLTTIAIKKDGTLWAWGRNQYGQLGDGTSGEENYKTTPTKIGSEINWASVSRGVNHTVALKTDGTLWALGSNDEGQLGDGTSGFENSKSTPTKIGSEINWASVSAGNYHTVAVKTDGTLWAWGWNDEGQLGDGTSGEENYKTTPTKIGSETNWASVSAGGAYTVAIKTDGTLWAWGYNYNGNLGDGTTTYRYTPTKIGNETNWASVSARVGTTLAIKTDGTLWAWGSNWDGQFGDGTKTDRTTPTKIGNETNWASVSVGTRHTVAIKTDGTLWAWGFNWDRQLGDDTLQPSYTPKKIGNETNWASVSAGMHHTVALKTGGTLWAWGSNYYGQLGDGTTTDRTPIQIILPE